MDIPAETETHPTDSPDLTETRERLARLAPTETPETPEQPETLDTLEGRATLEPTVFPAETIKETREPLEPRAQPET